MSDLVGELAAMEFGISAGEGDVSVTPSQDEVGRRVVHVQLSSP